MQQTIRGPFQIKNNWKNRLAVLLAGLGAGILCRLSDLCPYESLWSLSSIATLFGFWIASVGVITLCSTSHWGAFVNTVLYLFGMTCSFYGLKYLLGFFFPVFDNGGMFQTKLFLVYSALSLLCGVGSAALYCWNDRRWYASVLLALPAAALLAEGAACGWILLTRRMLLAQTVFDLAFAGWFAVGLGRRAAKKWAFCLTLGLAAALVYFAVYRQGMV